MSAIYWVCHCVFISMSTHTSVVIWVLIYVSFVWVSSPTPFFSPLSGLAPGKETISSVLIASREGSGGKKLMVPAPHFLPGFCDQTLKSKGFGCRVSPEGECGSSHHPRKGVTPFNPAGGRMSEQEWRRDLWVQKRGDTVYTARCMRGNQEAP